MGGVRSESDWIRGLSILGGGCRCGSGRGSGWAGGEGLVWIGVVVGGSMWDGARVWARGVRGPFGSGGVGPGCGGQTG